jgi:hypothetical protein
MTISPVLLYIWGILFLAFLALVVYRGQLTRYEAEQLFLEDEAAIVQRNKTEREKIVRSLSRIRPILSVCGVAAGIVTATVVTIYTYNAWLNIP